MPGFRRFPRGDRAMGAEWIARLAGDGRVRIMGLGVSGVVARTCGQLEIARVTRCGLLWQHRRLAPQIAAGATRGDQGWATPVRMTCFAWATQDELA